ncbi:MAG TPA: hypothetical protein VJ831_11455 [Jatrophihabitantaceae bacterium]|nr:hypothetical protein [Jatrophihabitantaceae bacterium]
MHVTRRGILLGATGVVLAAGAGTGAGYLRQLRDEPDTRAPPDLLAALASERALTRQLDAAIRRDRTQRQLLTPIRADHQAHADAIAAAIREVTGRAAPADTGRAARTAPSRAVLRSAEQTAATRTALRAGRLDGRAATLLASIAACEASHAEVLR